MPTITYHHSHSNSSKNWRRLILLASVSECLYFLIARLDPRAHIPVFLMYYGAVFLIYWIAANLFFGLKSASDNSSSNLSTKKFLLVGISFGVLFRVTLLLSPPSLSDDIYRYVWDGKVANHGINPFHYPPVADELTQLRDDQIYPRINHKDVPTIYPPANQILFLAIYKIHPSVTAFKIVAALFDLLTLALMLLILQKLGLDLKLGLIYAWNPLVIVEFSGSGHADTIGMFFLSLSLWLLFKNKLHLANLALALSFLSKFFTAVLWPLFFILKKKNRAVLAVMFVLVSAALYWPYAEAGERLFSGLLVYSEKWQFNASIFSLVLAAVTFLLPESWIIHLMITSYGYAPDAVTIASRGADLALMISKAIVALIFAAVLVYFLMQLRKGVSLMGERWIAKLGLILVGSFFLLSPTVQPWYLCWLLPFLVVAPNRAWLLLTGLVCLSYWTLIEYDRSGIWRESLWVKLVEYAPFYFFLIRDYLRGAVQKGSKRVSFPACPPADLREADPLCGRSADAGRRSGSARWTGRG